MENSELAAIRRANLKRITDVLRHSSVPMSRAELTDATGLSLMTVGKTADQLEEFGIITQKKREDGSPGRKSQVAALDECKRFCVYDYSVSERRLFLTDQSGRIISEYPIPDGGFDEAAAQAFMDCAMNECELVGCGLILPDFESADAVREFRDANGSKPDYAEWLTALSALGYDDGAHSVLHIRLNNPLCAAVVLQGKPYRGAFGRATDIAGLERLCGSLHTAIQTACLVIDPELVRIEVDSEAGFESSAKELREKLAGHGITLDFVLHDTTRAVNAVAAALLDKRIAKIFDS